jgi:hypothetical protein
LKYIFVINVNDLWWRWETHGHVEVRVLGSRISKISPIRARWRTRRCRWDIVIRIAVNLPPRNLGRDIWVRVRCMVLLVGGVLGERGPRERHSLSISKDEIGRNARRGSQAVDTIDDRLGSREFSE